MSEHALLSPSSASRWLACTPSARLEDILPDTTNQAAEEGTLAHAIGELMIARKLDRVIKKDYDKRLAELQQHPLYGGKEMYDYCEDYAVFVMERYSEALARNRDAAIYTETKLDMSMYVPDGFGTADVLIISDGVLDFIDLKYGKGVRVLAHENKQLMLYALGAEEQYNMIFDIQNVRMTIFQPRLDHVDVFEMQADDLRHWGETELKPKAKEAWDGNGKYNPGDHCLFCRAKIDCRANADYHLRLAQYEFKLADLLTEEELVAIYKQYDRFTNWIKGVSAYMLTEAVRGREWPGLKMVEGKPRRKWLDEKGVRELLIMRGHDENDIAPRKLIGLTAMQKEIGKTDFNKFLNNDTYIIKPQGKPSLAPIEDPRPAFTPDPASDFEDLEIED